MTKREYLTIEPEAKADASIIWLHGLGADGRDFAGIVDQLGLPKNHRLRFIFPSAPFMNVTVNQGMLMRAWYDIYDLNMLDKEDATGVRNSQQQIEEFIKHEIVQGIAYNRIVLAGFSQGGAMALYTALRCPEPLCGVIALSAYLPLSKNLADQHLRHVNMPIFMAHGMFDPIVPYDLGRATYELLEKSNYQVEWNSYPMQHTVCLEEIDAIGTFLRRCFGYA